MLAAFAAADFNLASINSCLGVDTLQEVAIIADGSELASLAAVLATRPRNKQAVEIEAKTSELGAKS